MESQMEERVMAEFNAGVAEADCVVVTIDPQQQPTISSAEQALAEADPNQIKNMPKIPKKRSRN